ncbi:MAG: hypothetical protein QME58_05710 [Bacteroidota bacterium]|nr:hypothetical protein [Bacteroidota bacterium]
MLTTQNVAKKLLQVFTGLTVFSFLFVSAVTAQTVEERLQKFGKGYAKGYMQPFVNAFGANLNSGIFHTADVSTGIDVYVGAKFMFALIPDEAKKFQADLSDLNYYRPINKYPTPVETATIFGTDGTIVPGSIIPGDTLRLANGMNSGIFLIPVPHIAIGNILGTRALIRYYPTTKIGDFGEFSFLGFGLQHNIGQWFVPLPFDWSAHIMYQNLKLKPLIEASALSFGTQISKTLLFATFYGGFAYETSSMELKYQWTPPGVAATEVKITMNGENTFRITAGLGLKFFIFHINAEYNYSNQPVALLGLGIAI